MRPRDVAIKIGVGIAASTMLSLAGCASTPTSIPQTQPISIRYKALVICPEVKQYSSVDYKNLSTELQSHPDLVYVYQWLKDYTGIRDAGRVCTAKKEVLENKVFIEQSDIH